MISCEAADKYFKFRITSNTPLYTQTHSTLTSHFLSGSAFYQRPEANNMAMWCELPNGSLGLILQLSTPDIAGEQRNTGGLQGQ